ncbi:unnamed protein product [Anisakis simplex]|uniref:WD repeat-containing protein 76 n=1 Tax=Anisakis simplex TaxID=6269 RepID=A0A0M3KFX1_ANISI|nr:unnamed protein product [Anisakis simplex]
METIQRPKPGESDEDILRMQEEFQKTHLQGKSCAPISVNLKRMSNRTNPLKSNEEDLKINKSHVIDKNQLSKGERKKISASKRNRGRFTIDLETLQEESSLDIVTAVQEKNLDYLENTDQTSFMFSGLSNEYSKDDGFPDVIDLSRYFKPDESGKILENPNDGRSLFAIEFDRLNGKIYGIL